MKKLMCGLLLMMMSINILAEETPKVKAKSGTTAEIKKEVSGENKSTTTEGREIIDGEEKSPTVKKIDLNLVSNEDQQLKTSTIAYDQEEDNSALLSEVSEKKAKPNYVVWGLGILGVLVAGLALSSK